MRSAAFENAPFRLGTSSYIIPDEIIPNVRFLADKVDDIELVLFETGQEGNIPSVAQVAELNALALDHALSYTVHLPLDLKLSGSQAEQAVDLILMTVAATQALNPYAYVLHLDSHQVSLDLSAEEHKQWQANSMMALYRLLPSFDSPKQLAIENLESYPAEWNQPILDELSISECIDIGHLWLQQRDATEYLKQRLSHTRVIHLHGIGTRDHQSLKHQPPETVAGVINVINQMNYPHVVTLEVFSEDDFNSSIATLEALQ